MSRDINKLREPFRASIKELIKRAKAAGLPIIVTSTTRTLAEQKELVRKGFSRTLKSKHLTGHAADLAFQVNRKLSYRPELYEKLYTIIKDLPFVIWPYRDLKWGWDWSHTQYDKDKVGKIVHSTDMEKIQALTDQVKRLQEEVRKLTREVHKAEANLEQERRNHKDTLKKYKAEFSKRTTAEDDIRAITKNLKSCELNKFKGLSLLKKIEILFRK